jgi:hypothetical protein
VIEIKDKDSGLISVQKMLKGLKKMNLSVGVFSDAVNTEEKTQTYVADYAIANEYGIGHIPERSFIRSTVNEKQDEWSKLMGNVLLEAFEGKQNLDTGIYKVGAIARRDIIAKIDSNINPPNAPSTIKKKGVRKNKTLIDHGVLRSSIEAKLGMKE